MKIITVVQSTAKLNFIALSLILLARTASATTYYIDFQGGQDSNDGRSMAKPWKHHPYMPNWLGAYSHSPGDRFVFRGSVKWDHTCWPLRITAGGSPLQADYYGADPAWFNGTAFQRPLFNAEFQANQIIVVSGTSYIRIDNLELTGLMADQDSGGNSSIYLSNSTYVNMTNLKVHNWNHSTAVVTNNGNFGGIYNNPGAGTPISGVVVDHCDIGDPENGGNQGSATRFIETLSNSIIHDTSQGILHGGRYVFGNTFYNLGATFDPAEHTNVTYLDQFNGRAESLSSGAIIQIYNNIFYDNTASVGAVYANYGTSGSSTMINWYIYGNVVYSNASNCILLDPYNSPDGLMTNVYIWNNTCEIERATTAAIRVVSRPGTVPPTLLDVKNDHFVFDGSGYISCGGTTVCTLASNIVMDHASAAAQGYTKQNRFAPVAPTNATVRTGINLSSMCTAVPGLCSVTAPLVAGAGLPRPSIGAWDIGSYIFMEGPDKPTGLRTIVH